MALLESVEIVPYFESALECRSIPLPTLEKLFSKLAGVKNITKLDLPEAYLQLKVNPDSHKYLAINTHRQIFSFQRLAFGISSARAIFQKGIESVFKNLTGVLPYLDDLIITGKDEQEHRRNLESAFSLINDYGLRLNLNKC